MRTEFSIADGIPTGELADTQWIGHEGSVNSVVFSPNGDLVASGGNDGTLRLWNTFKKQPFEKKAFHESAITSLKFSSNGKLLVSGGHDKNLIIWNSEKKQPIASLSGHNDLITDVNFSSDGNWMISSDRSGELILWSLKEEISNHDIWTAHVGQTYGVDFSSDGKLLASYGEDAFLRLWNFKTKNIVYEVKIGLGQTDENRSEGGVRFINDNKSIAVLYDSELLIIDAQNGAIAKRLKKGDGMLSIRSFAYSGLTKKIITSQHDGTLSLWDVSSGKIIKNILGEEEGSHSTLFSPDGNIIVTNSGNHLRLWDVNTGQPIGDKWYPKSNRPSIGAIAFSPNGDLIVSGGNFLGAKNTLDFWDMNPENWAKKACSIANRNFSLTEWQRFIGDALPYQKTCPDLPAPGEEGWVEPYAGG